MTPPREKPEKDEQPPKGRKLGVRIRQPSIVDIVHVDNIAVHAGRVLHLAPGRAAEAVEASNVLELVTEDD